MAAAALEQAGMRIVARNWRTPEAELDLIALSADGTCVFCEVRARTGEESGDPLETIDARKRARVVRAARIFLASDDAPPVLAAARAYRFDAVGVTFYTDGRTPRLVHIPAAFEIQ